MNQSDGIKNFNDLLGRVEELGKQAYHMNQPFPSRDEELKSLIDKYFVNDEYIPRLYASWCLNRENEKIKYRLRPKRRDHRGYVID